MRKYKLLIVEDQENYVESLMGFLKKYDDIIDYDSITIAMTFVEARTLILNKTQFDASILDYKLDDGQTCLKLLEQTKDNMDYYGQLVFTTIDPIENENFHKYHLPSKYLILEKPYDIDNVLKFTGELQEKLYNKEQVADNKRTFNLGLQGEIIIDDINKILYIEGSQQYCNFYILDNGIVKEIKYIKGTLDQQFTLLNNTDIFLRVHKSYIVNTHKIKRGKKDERTTGWLSFSDKDYNERTNLHVARYSVEHSNYTELKKRTGFAKI